MEGQSMTKQTEQRFVEFIRDCQFSLDPYVRDHAKKLMREWLGPEQDCGLEEWRKDER